MKVPFIRECCFCGTTLEVSWLDHATLSPANLQQYDRHHKIVSHGACDPCFAKEMAAVEEAVEQTSELSIEELEQLLKEEDSHV